MPLGVLTKPRQERSPKSLDNQPDTTLDEKVVRCTVSLSLNGGSKKLVSWWVRGESGRGYCNNRGDSGRIGKGGLHDVCC